MSERLPDPAPPLRICAFPLRMRENAFLSLLYGPLERAGVSLRAYDWFLSSFAPVDVFHVHWPDAVVMGASRFRAFAKFAAFAFSVLAFRARGVPIVHQVHNIDSHDQSHPFLEALLWRMFIPRVSVFIHMNTASLEAFRRRWPAATGRHEILFPPCYASPPGGAGRGRAAIRAELGVGDADFLFLTFGLLRPYKGIEALIDAFLALDRGDSFLVIAGKPLDPAYGAEIERLSGQSDRIRFIPGFLPEERLDALLAAADLVVLAHRKLNNSGVAIKALSSGRRILAPALGAMPELAEIVGPDWVTCFDRIDRDTLARAAALPAATGAPDLSAFEPEAVATRLLEILSPYGAPRPGREGAAYAN